MKILYLFVLVVSFMVLVSGNAKLNPEAPTDLERELDDVARVGSVVVDGDVCQKIVTQRAKEFLFARDPRDEFLAGDNYDVDDVAFNTVKKTLARLSHLSSFPADVNLWMPIEGHAGKIQLVIRKRALRGYGSADGAGIEDGTTGHGHKQARLDICSSSSS